jgi:hypothetical protein
MKKAFKVIFTIFLIAFIVMQFFRIDKSVPPFEAANGFLQIEKPPMDIHPLLVNACYDCHSYEATYPWYANIAPVSWFLQSHIVEGREHLNFSTWGTYSTKDQQKLLEEVSEEIQEGKMPLKSYTIIHKDAIFTTEEKALLLNWLNEKGNSGKNEVRKKEKSKKERERDND